MAEAPRDSRDPARKRQRAETPDSPPSARESEAVGPKSAARANVVFLSLLHGLLDRGVGELTLNIAHQVNATGYKPGGLAAALVEMYPYANVWKGRKERGTEEHLLGTVRIDPGPDPEKPAVFSLYGQLHGGKPKEPDDSSAHRAALFASALADLRAKAPDLDSIAFPENIGCAIGGGDWHEYKAMIHDFAAAMPNCAVYIVRCEQRHK